MIMTSDVDNEFYLVHLVVWKLWLHLNVNNTTSLIGKRRMQFVQKGAQNQGPFSNAVNLTLILKGTTYKIQLHGTMTKRGGLKKQHFLYPK